jgi:DNA helicase-2/ATP-dependent DNA helicase PcrA
VHAFAYRALGQPIVAESKLKEWNEAYPSYQLSGSGQAKNPDDGYTAPEGSTEGDAIKLEYARLRTIALPRSSPLWQSTYIAGFTKRWEDWKKQCGYVDFTDMLEQAVKEVDTAPGEPSVIIGDEWQDVGSLEMQLIEKWAHKAEHLVLAGDFLQSLFGYRGTDPMLLQNLWQTHDSTRKPLQHSYRLPGAVYDYCQEWQKRFKKMMRVSFEPRTDEDGKVVPGRVLYEGAPTYNNFTPQSIEELITEHQHNNRSIMFVATCGYMIDPILKCLREAGIPFHNPLRPSNGKWNPLPQKRGRGNTIVDRVLAFTRPSVAIWGEHARFWTADDFKAWTGGLPVTGIFQRGLQNKIKELDSGASDEAISDLIAACFVPDALKHIAPEPDLRWYLDAVKGSDTLRDFVVEVIHRRGVQSLQTRPSVIVGTVHSLKGAEADTVVLFPDFSLEAGSAARASADAAEEMRRVFYVGITRARENLILAQPASKNAVRW